MSKFLRTAAAAIVTLMISGSLALAQTPDPGTDGGRKPATGQTTPGRGRGRGKKAPKKGAKKRGKKPATTDPPK
jgi:hypothetical protein